MGKCASKQQQQQLKANTSGFHQRNYHHDLFQQQIFNEYIEKNEATAGADATRSSISEQSIFLLIENEVMPFYQLAQSFIFACSTLFFHSFFYMGKSGMSRVFFHFVWFTVRVTLSTIFVHTVYCRLIHPLGRINKI